MSRCSINETINKPAVYMTYQWWIGACNELTQDNLDPVSKTPETKYCAVRVIRIDNQKEAEALVKEKYAVMRNRLIGLVETAESQIQ